jgi:hypothetical protein
VPDPRSSSDPALARWQATAQALPCSALSIKNEADGIHVGGIAVAGRELNELLAGLRPVGRLADNITRAGPFVCAPIATMTALQKRATDILQPTLSLGLDHPKVYVGAHIGFDVKTTLSYAYLDIYQADRSVRHVLRPAPSDTATKTHVNWKSAWPPGPRLAVAIGSATPLGLGVRPETEKSADFLPVLQASLESAAVPATADFRVLTVVPDAEPSEQRAGKTQPPPGPSPPAERCSGFFGRIFSATCR